jgi:hypothetical protein
MSKKDANGRKSRGIAGLATIEDVDAEETASAAMSDAESSGAANDNGAASDKGAKAKGESNGNFSVADVRKAAAFVNQIGGLDKALAVLQILKVAKEVQ